MGTVRLLVVRNPKVAPLARVMLETMCMRAEKLYPDNELLAWRWVQAKFYVQGRKPAVDIGINRVDTTRAARGAPVGLEMPLEVPSFLRKFLKA